MTTSSLLTLLLLVSSSVEIVRAFSLHTMPLVPKIMQQPAFLSPDMQMACQENSIFPKWVGQWTGA